jgi:hypothetical protein
MTSKSATPDPRGRWKDQAPLMCGSEVCEPLRTIQASRIVDIGVNHDELEMATVHQMLKIFDTGFV